MFHIAYKVIVYNIYNASLTPIGVFYVSHSI